MMDFRLGTQRLRDSDRARLPTYLLLEKSPVIASDIMSTLEADGPCRIVHLTHADGIVRAVLHLSRLTAALLEMNPLDLLNSEIETALNGHDAQIILTKGDALGPEFEARGWKLLVRPFSDLMLRELLSASRPGLPRSASR